MERHHYVITSIVLVLQTQCSWWKYIFPNFLKDQTLRILHLGQNYNRVFVTSYNWHTIKYLLQIQWK